VFTAVVTVSNSINTLTATTVVTITEFIPPTDVSLTAFGRDWTGVGGVVWPVTAGVVVLGMVVVAFLGRRRER
jgi:hypothetical protein